jgi:hypothetical protein
MTIQVGGLYFCAFCAGGANRVLFSSVFSLNRGRSASWLVPVGGAFFVSCADELEGKSSFS